MFSLSLLGLHSSKENQKLRISLCSYLGSLQDHIEIEGVEEVETLRIQSEF